MNNSKPEPGLKWIWTALRVIIGVVLIAFLLWKLNLGRILEHVRAMDIRYLIAAMATYFAFIMISAWRWQILLDRKKIVIPFGRTVAIYFISLFFNNVFPTTIGGDVTRVLYAAPERKAESLATVFADRIMGFIGLFIFSLGWVLYIMVFLGRTEFLLFVIVGLVLLLLITYILFSEKVYLFFAPLVEKIKIFRIGERLSNLHKTMTDFGGAWGVITLCVIQSIVMQALLAFAPLLVLRSMGDYKLGIVPFFLYVPIINIISMIPVSFNALGVRENAYVLLFSRVGLEGAVSFTMSIISFFLVFIYSLVGGVCFIFYRRKR